MSGVQAGVKRQSVWWRDGFVAQTRTGRPPHRGTCALPAARVVDRDRPETERLVLSSTGDPSLQAAARSNTRGNVRLTFGQRAKDQLQDMATSNFNLYKRIADDRAFGKALLDFLFEEFWRAQAEHGRGEDGDAASRSPL